MRRAFSLPANDEKYLDSLGLPWETIVEGAHRWLLLHQFPVPYGYKVQQVIAALRIDGMYPDTQIDMVYVNPSLVRSDEKTIAALSDANFDNKVFQQWSRHRTATNPWQPGIDDINTHLELVKDWFAREFKVR